MSDIENTPEWRHAMTPEADAALRKAFAPEVVGKLPKISCSACSRDPKKVCGEHRKSECSVCGNWITSKHVHLDYVGHADVTDRLLSVDPGWSWEPAAWSPDGTPMIVVGNREAVMWVRLTVCGVTRLGVGIVQAGSFELEKQLIGDAIRNAAMRFGVALDLWAKHDALESTLATGPPPAPPQAEPLADGMVDTRAAKRELVDALTEAGAADVKASAAEAWKASRVAAGPIPRERLDRIIGDALDAVFAEAESDEPPHDGAAQG